MTAARARGAVAATVLLGLLTLPFHPYWNDAEMARRGLLAVAAAAILFRYPALLRGTWCRPEAWFLAFLLWNLLGLLWAMAPWNGVFRCVHWASLLVLLRAGALLDPTTVHRAILPAGLVVAAWGCLQALGWHWPWPDPVAPVGTMGNRNAAAEVIALTAAALLTAPRRSALTLPALVLCGAFLGAAPTGARTGLLAAAGAAVLLLVRAPARRRTGAGVACLLAGFLLFPLLAVPAASEQPPASTSTERPITSSLQQRLWIWSAALDLAAEAPLHGHGPGQFRTVYPLVRPQEEIEQSSFGRSFYTRVDTAHDDPLQVLVENGGVGLALLLLFLGSGGLRLARRHGAAALALPAAFALLALARAPALNAPAVAAFVLLMGAGATAPGEPKPQCTTRGPRLLAVALLVAGLALVVGQSLPRVWAGRLLPHDDHLHEALARDAIARGDPAAARAWLDRARAAGPYEPRHLVLEAEWQLKSRARDRALTTIDTALAIDPIDPEARLLRAEILFQRGATADVLRTLYDRPHPRLRAALADTFRTFALGTSAAQAAVRARYTAELSFVEVLDARAACRAEGTDPAESARVNAAVTGCLDSFRRLPGPPSDLRPLLCAAWLAALRGDGNDVRFAADTATRQNLRLEELHRPLVQEMIDLLARDPAWAALL